MISVWRDPRRAGWLMWAYFLLSLAVGPVVHLSVGSASPGHAGDGYDWIFSAFFSWRVTRGGRISRMLLIVGTGFGYLGTAFNVAGHFGPATFGVLAICVVQLALLMSPSVYWRTRPQGWAEPPAATRVLPPLTLLLLGVFAGLSVTLIGLAHGGWPLPGCDDPGAAPALPCGSFAEGYPLAWVTAAHGAPSANWAAMAKDWVQYAVIAASVLYTLWLATLARRAPLSTRFPAAAAVGCALGGLTLAVLTGRFPATWLTRGHYDPGYDEGHWFSAHALLADAAAGTLAGLCACLAVWLIAGRRGRPSGAEPP